MKLFEQPDGLEGYIILVEERDLLKPLDLPELKGDWPDNTEAVNTVYFTVTVPANGTIKLVWWDADVNPSHSPVGGEWMRWIIKRGATIVSKKTRNGPWSGVDNITVPVSTTPYTIYTSYIWWEEEGFLEEDGSVFYNQYMSTPGQVIKLNY